ncbi:DUF1992 domain-containing protein [Nocardioides ferulae]|uniref:DnaJ family domain-containing protein n=1 Tax=Nocardioides ferulae TaxID=2340821 RepID=UPI000EB2EBA3|nr:DUF1992 domain-containing protein [Nocardioides ferulae]
MPDDRDPGPGGDQPRRTPDGSAAPAQERDSRAAARARIAQQQTWVDLQVRRAMERGDFDDLPGQGRPIEGLEAEHDPDWWLKRLIERERLVVLPPSVQLRREDAELDGRLDAMAAEAEVRREVEEFNARVIAARYRLPEGPPLVTMPRDVDETVAAWRERRDARRAAARAAAEAAPPPRARRRRWRRRG